MRSNPDRWSLEEAPHRDAKIGRIYEGTSNIQLMTIAKKLLGK